MKKFGKTNFKYFCTIISRCAQHSPILRPLVGNSLRKDLLVSFGVRSLVRSYSAGLNLRTAFWLSPDRTPSFTVTIFLFCHKIVINMQNSPYSISKGTLCGLDRLTITQFHKWANHPVHGLPCAKAM